MADSLGYILKRLREKKHFTQAEVIERSGMDRSSSYISSLETNKTSPTVEELEALAVIFDLHKSAVGRRLREPEHGAMIEPRMAGQDAVGFARPQQNSWQ